MKSCFVCLTVCLCLILFMVLENGEESYLVKHEDLVQATCICRQGFGYVKSCSTSLAINSQKCEFNEKTTVHTYSG